MNLQGMSESYRQMLCECLIVKSQCLLAFGDSEKSVEIISEIEKNLIDICIKNS